MPHAQREHENETIHKTKHCEICQRNRLSSTKESFGRTRSKSSAKSINVVVPTDDAYNLAGSTKDLQESSARSNKTDTKPHKKGKVLLRVVKDDVDAKDAVVNLHSPDNTRKHNMGKCICYCKDEDHSAVSSSRKTSTRISGSFGREKPEEMNHPMAEHENKVLHILQHKSSRLQHEDLNQPHALNLINYLVPIKSYQDMPVLLTRYEAIPDIPFYMMANMGNAIDGIPSTSFESRPNFLVGSNVHHQYGLSTHQHVYPNPSVFGRNREIERPDTSTSSSISYTDPMTTKTGSVHKSYPTEITGKVRESPGLTTKISHDYAGKSIVKMGNNFYSTKMIGGSNTKDFSSSDETLRESKDSAETTELANNARWKAYKHGRMHETVRSRCVRVPCDIAANVYGSNEREQFK